VYWTQGRDRARCHLVDGEGARRLAAAVNRAKGFLGGTGGGSFLINEHGQVLVPASEDSRIVALAGTISGPLIFENPFEPDEPFDLSDDRGLEPGDAWDRPYVGMWYNLSKRGQLYRVEYSACGEKPVSMTDPGGLVRSLRRIRPYASVRFIVNPHGIVLTKVPRGRWRSGMEESWTSVYVCRIDPDRWLAKEV